MKELKDKVSKLIAMLARREDEKLFMSNTLDYTQGESAITKKEVYHKSSESNDYPKDEEDGYFTSYIIHLHDLPPIAIPCPVKSICTFKGEHNNISFVTFSLNVSPLCHIWPSSHKWNSSRNIYCGLLNGWH